MYIIHTLYSLVILVLFVHSSRQLKYKTLQNKVQLEAECKQVFMI